jgi:hypothetical protein
MKVLKTLFSVIFVFCYYPIFSQENIKTIIDTNNTIEETEIKLVIENQYIEGLRTRNFSLIRNICMPETKLMNASDNGEFYVATLDSWSKKFDPLKPPFKKLEYSILKIDRTETAAQVKILFLIDSKNYVTDFLHMLRIEGKWQIVNIIDY